MNKKRKAGGDGNTKITEDSGWSFDKTAMVKDEKLLQ